MTCLPYPLQGVESGLKAMLGLGIFDISIDQHNAVLGDTELSSRARWEACSDGLNSDWTWRLLMIWSKPVFASGRTVLWVRSRSRTLP